MAYLGEKSYSISYIAIFVKGYLILYASLFTKGRGIGVGELTD